MLLLPYFSENAKCGVWRFAEGVSSTSFFLISALFPLHAHQFSLSSLTLPQKISSREQLVPHFGCLPQTLGAFTRNQWLLIFPSTVFFMCGLTWPPPYWPILLSYFHSDVPLYKQRKLVEGRCQTACHILFSICSNQVYSVLFRSPGCFWMYTMHFRRSIRR